MKLRYRKAIIHQKIGDMEEDTEIYVPYELEKDDDDDVNSKLEHVLEDKFTENIFLEYNRSEDELEEEPIRIGRWGHARLSYIQEYKKDFYNDLLQSGKLKSYLEDIERQAKIILDSTVSSMAEANGTDEKLKAEDMRQWVGLMNNYRQCAAEIINAEIIYV